MCSNGQLSSNGECTRPTIIAGSAAYSVSFLLRIRPDEAVTPGSGLDGDTDEGGADTEEEESLDKKVLLRKVGNF